MAKTTQKTQTPSAPEQRYTLDRLKANCNVLFGVSQYAFEGAMADKSGPFTIAEAAEIIRAFKEKPVKTGMGV